MLDFRVLGPLEVSDETGPLLLGGQKQRAVLALLLIEAPRPVSTDRLLAALEERIDADLEAGRHAELVGEVEALVDRHPVRERLRAHLMLALYRSGRQAEALTAYQAARHTLVEQLGIEPGPDLQQLHGE